MVYKVFLDAIKQALLSQLGDGYSLDIRQVSKNNGLILDGLCIRKTGQKAAPTIYLNSFYDLYQEGYEIQQLSEQILNLYYENSCLPTSVLEHFVQFSQLKDKIAYKLINAQSNRLLLQTVPHIPYLDLAIVFYLFLDENDTGQMTALIHKEHQAMWEISTEELFELAKENTKRLLPAEIKSMNDVMKEIAIEHLGKDYRDDFIEQLREENSQSPLYVLSNRCGLYGASCILYEDLLKHFADGIEDDLILLPSSIHEVLILPDKHGADGFCPHGAASESKSYDFLGDMVTTINQAEVPTEDQLSNQVYLFSRLQNRLTIVTASSVPVGTTNP